MRKAWWKRKKFWGVVITWIVSMFGHKVGLEPDSVITIATGVGAMTGLEAITDIVGAARGEGR